MNFDITHREFCSILHDVFKSSRDKTVSFKTHLSTVLRELHGINDYKDLFLWFYFPLEDIVDQKRQSSVLHTARKIAELKYTVEYTLLVSNMQQSVINPTILLDLASNSTRNMFIWPWLE